MNANTLDVSGLLMKGPQASPSTIIAETMKLRVIVASAEVLSAGLWPLNCDRRKAPAALEARGS